MTSTKTGLEPQSPQSGPKTYEVGYKKPPVKNRFQPGKSGNPSGKRAKRPTPEEYLCSLMGKYISVNENGISKKITRTEALIHKMFGAAIKGDIRAAESIMKILSKQAAKKNDEPKPLNLEIYTLEELNWLEKILEKRDKSLMDEEIEEVRRKYGVKTSTT